MKRRDFLTLGAGALVVRPTFARAQQPRSRRLAVLHAAREGDPDSRANLEVFRVALSELGWSEGSNIRTEYRWAGGDRKLMSSLATELAASNPDAFLAITTPVTSAIQAVSKSIPIVFVNVSDPIGDGIAKSLSHPGTKTGFVNFEAPVATKWLQLLKEIAPAISQAAIIINPETAPGGGRYFSSPFVDAARLLGIKPSVALVRSEAEIEKVVASLGLDAGALVVPPGGAFTRTHRDAIIRSAQIHKVPAIYFERFFALTGGLISYGPDYSRLFSQAASYIDRILKGTSPAELPIQLPSKFEMVINLRTAKALSLTVPNAMQLLADEIIE